MRRSDFGGLKMQRKPQGITRSVWVADCYFIVNVLDLPFASLPVVYSRPFASKAVF